MTTTIHATQPTQPTQQLTQTTYELRVLRIQQVAEKLSIGKSTIYDWLNEQSPRYDSTFPKPIKLNAKSIGWLSSEIDAWLLNRVNLTREEHLSTLLPIH